MLSEGKDGLMFKVNQKQKAKFNPKVKILIFFDFGLTFDV